MKWKHAWHEERWGTELYNILQICGKYKRGVTVGYVDKVQMIWLAPSLYAQLSEMQMRD